VSGRITNAIRAVDGFFNGFLPSWAEGSVPRGQKPPYISYELVAPKLAERTPFYARVWYRQRSYDALLEMCDRIDAAIGPGCVLETPGGSVWLYAEDKFMQLMPQGADPDVKCAYLSMSLFSNTN